MKKLERMVKKAVASMIDIEIYGWPPVCIGMIYQPERPQKKPEMCMDLKTPRVSNYINSYNIK